MQSLIVKLENKDIKILHFSLHFLLFFCDQLNKSQILILLYKRYNNKRQRCNK